MTEAAAKLTATGRFDRGWPGAAGAATEDVNRKERKERRDRKASLCVLCVLCGKNSCTLTKLSWIVVRITRILRSSSVPIREIRGQESLKGTAAGAGFPPCSPNGVSCQVDHPLPTPRFIGQPDEPNRARRIDTERVHRQ